MDKNKATGFSGIGSFPVKRAKVKLPLPSDNLIALGASSTSSSPSSSTAASKLALGKRDRVDVQNVIAVKKPKLPVPQLRPGSADNWNDAVEIDPQDLLQKVLNCDESSSEVEAYIGGAIKNMKSSRLKLDSALYLTLLYLAKVKAQAFMNEPTIELLCSLLKREPAQNAAIRKKLNANNNIQIIASNLMLAVYSDEIYWPKQFMKVYLDDALTERIWVDRVAPEVILLEGVLVKLLNMGILKSHPITPVEAIEMADLLIKRAAAYSDPADPIRGLNIQSEELFQLLFRNAVYRKPDKISMPTDYEPPAMAISDWYWKVWILLLIITAHNPTGFGQKAWKSYPTLSVLIEMTVTNHFEFPPPTMQGEDLRGKLRQILALEKQQILQFEVQLAAASTKTQINEQNSLLLSKLIQYDPEGPAREPPPVVLDQLRSVASSLKLGSLLCQSRSPDFLYEIIQRQQKQRTAHQLTAYPNSMPWLGDLVEANEETYSILSVRSLCVYLLGQIYDEDCNLQSLEYIGKGGDRVKRKEKRRKQLRLIAHLQGILNTNEQLSRDLIEFFMERLSIQNSSLRQLSSKALNLIFRDPDSIDDFSLCPENNLSNWLLNKLPLTKYFEFLKLIVCEGLRLAILVETQPKDICIYVQFLEKYASPLDTGIALSLSNLLIDRTIITKHLVQGPLREGFLSSATKLFHAYLHTVKKRDNRGYWSEAQDKVMIQWQAGETAILNIMIVHAMIILLTHGPTESSRKLYDSLMSTWFSDPPPQSFLVDTSEEALLIPDWLKMKLIRSSSAQLADAGLMDLEPHQLILFIQSFGIPEPSMEKLLSALDECCDTNEATLMASITDRKFMKHLVEVQWMRGVTAGHKFAHMLDMPDE